MGPTSNPIKAAAAEAGLVTTTASDLGISVAAIKTSYSLTTSVSMTVQSVLALSTGEGSFTCYLELDFKYPVSEFLDTFPGFNDTHQNKVYDAEDIKMPYIITNALANEIHSETHFFRHVPKLSETDKGKSSSDVSMYGNPSTVCQQATREGNFIKCEKYVMTLTTALHTVKKHKPYDQLYLFLKLATDGRPGTEQTRFVFDRADSGFNGFSKPIGGYNPIDSEPTINSINIQFSEGEEQSGVYPRVYVSMRYGKPIFTNVLKFYMIPAAIFVLLVIDRVEGADLLGISSTLILADIALLFVTSDNVMTFQEQAVIINIVMLLVATLVLRLVSFDLVDFGVVAFSMVGANVAVNVIVCLVQFFMARKEQKRVHDLVSSDDFAKAATQLSVL